MNAVEGAGGIGLQRPARLVRKGQPIGDSRGPNQPGALPVAEPIGDVGFGIGIEQLVHDVVQGRLSSGVEIDHPRLQMAGFPDQDPAKAPQRGAGKLPAALLLQHLRAARDHPDALGGDQIGVGQALDQRQRTGRGPIDIRRHLRGCRPRSVPVQPGQVNHPAERHILLQLLQERLPRLALLHVQGDTTDSGAGLLGPRISGRQHHPLIPGRQSLRQFRRHAAVVGRQHPDPGSLHHLDRSLSHDDPPVRSPGRSRFIHSQDRNLSESRIPQGLSPHRRAGQGVVGAVAVGKSPPAVQLPERQIQPTLAAQVLEGHQLPGGGQKLPAVGQRLRQVPGRVQHVGGNQQIVAVGVEALIHRVLFDIQHPVLDGASAEAPLGLGKEAGRDVGVGVVEPSLRKLRQHRGGCRSGARPDLQDPQPPPLRQPGRQLPNGIGQHPVGRARHRRLQIQIGRAGFSAAEQECERVRLVAKHLGQGAAGAPE